MSTATAPNRTAVHLIHAYRHPKMRNTWVFDDARFGLTEEPFVLGASEAIDRVVKNRAAENTAAD